MYVCMYVCMYLIHRPSEFTYAFGGAILVSKSEFADNWTLTKKNFKAIKEVRGSDEAQLVRYHYYYYYYYYYCGTFMCVCM